MAHKKRYRQNTAQKPLIGTKLRIFKRAIDLFLSRDHHGASLQEIAYDSQVTVPSFYYYFGDKDELIAEMYKYLRDNHYRDEEAAGASISEVAKTWFPMIYYGRPYATARKILRIAVREYRFDRRAAEAVAEVYRSTKARIAREVRVMIENGVIEPIDAEAFAAVYASVCLASAMPLDGSAPFVSPEAERQRRALVGLLRVRHAMTNP